MSLEYIQNIQNKVDINETIKLLRGALSDELLAVHSYWVQSKIIQGIHKDAIIKELTQHREEETGHANMLMERILQLGGNPEIRPLDWDQHTKCRYQNNMNWDQRAIVENAIQGEKCAIEHYTKMAEFLQPRDTTSYDMIMNILEDEYEHVRDLNKLLDLIDSPKQSKHKPAQKDK